MLPKILNFTGIPEAGVETRIMAARRKLLSGLKTTRTLLDGPSGQQNHTTSLQPAAADALATDIEGVGEVKPYGAVPGPTELPLIGNAWRFLPYIGKSPYLLKISAGHVSSVSFRLVFPKLKTSL
jgi:hypothetical protein